MLDAFEFKTVFQQLSDYTIKRVEHIVNEEDAHLDEEKKRINTYQYELLSNVTDHFKHHEIGISKIKSDEFILHLLLPYYLSGENVFIITPDRNRYRDLIQAMVGKDKSKNNVYTRLGLTSKEKSKAYTLSIMPQSHERTYDSTGYDMIICMTSECSYQTGVNTPKSFDMTVYGEDRFSLVILDSADKYTTDSWDSVIKSFGKSKRLFIVDTEFDVDEENSKYIIQ